MAERPSLGRDDSYNRVTVSRDLKSQIMSMIADSSESLPLNTVEESDEDDVDKKDSGKLAPPTTNGGGSKLAADPLNAGDFATPTPEKPNPLEQVATVRVDSSQKGGTVTGTAASDLATASPMRSHDQDGPELGSLGKRISRMVTHSDTNLADTDKARDEEGATASRATTATQGSKAASPTVGSRPGLDKRQSTMKRISSAFKRSVSKNQ